MVRADGLLGAGLDALAAGSWEDAAAALEQSAHDLPPDDAARADALDGLAEARWWLGHQRDALEAREAAYGLRRELGDDAAAARAAAWLAREFAAGLGNVAAARGWLGRAETLTRKTDDPTVDGWVALARATLADDAREQARHADRAVERARAVGDPDLEVLALARLGLARIVFGDIDEGMACLDEAMAAATAGETQAVTTVPQLCCDFVLASELVGEPARFAQWSEMIDRVAARHGRPSPVTFCTTCCAETASAKGDYAAAEKQLHVAVVELETSGCSARCVPPGTKLAELLLLQGRLEEAQRAVGEADDETSLAVRARLALAQGNPGLAGTLAERCARRVGAGLRAGQMLLVLVDAHLARGDLDAAGKAVDRLRHIADDNLSKRAAGYAVLGRGKVAAAAGEHEPAGAAFEAALDHLRGSASLELAETHLELARLHASDRADVARAEAKAAVAGFDALGATRLADEAASFLRGLGDRTRVGPKDVGVLTRREQEVLRLVAQGLTNAEIAARLFISTKTAGNHVSAILSKLGLRSRTEAAAYATLNAERYE